jgi:hypothetical protein
MQGLAADPLEALRLFSRATVYRYFSDDGTRLGLA